MGAVSLNALKKSFPGSDSRRWLFYLIGNYDEFPIKTKALRANDAHSHEKKLLLRKRARRGQESCAIDDFIRVSV